MQTKERYIEYLFNINKVVKIYKIQFEIFNFKNKEF